MSIGSWYRLSVDAVGVTADGVLVPSHGNRVLVRGHRREGYVVVVAATGRDVVLMPGVIGDAVLVRGVGVCRVGMVVRAGAGDRDGVRCAPVLPSVMVWVWCDGVAMPLIIDAVHEHAARARHEVILHATCRLASSVLVDPEV